MTAVSFIGKTHYFVSAAKDKQANLWIGSACSPDSAACPPINITTVCCQLHSTDTRAHSEDRGRMREASQPPEPFVVRAIKHGETSILRSGPVWAAQVLGRR